MSGPSIRLRCMTFVMRVLAKPLLARFGTPERAQRDFARLAPLLFRPPKGTTVVDGGPYAQVTWGTPNEGQAVLYLHGGAFVAGSRHSYCAMGGRLAKRTGATVFVADYPKLQTAPFPAAPNAVLAAWDHLLAQGWLPHQIVLAGDSAGGNLVFGLFATVLQRGQKPAGVLAFSPWTDLTLSGASIQANAKKDAIIPANRMEEAVGLYLAGADPANPMASPLFADFPDPSPVLIQVGADEVLFSDAQRIAEKVNATLDVWDHVPHVWQLFEGRLPEANVAMDRASDFIQTSFESAKRNPTASAT